MMADPRNDMVVEAAREVLECIPGVEVMFAVGKEDSFHPLAVRFGNSWRVVADGWSQSLHRMVVHTMVSSDAADRDALMRDVRAQLGRMAKQQNARAERGIEQLKLTRPLPRELFDDDGSQMQVDHMVVPMFAVYRLLAEEDLDKDAVRRRIASMLNRELNRREGLSKTADPGFTLKNSTLGFPLPIGDGGSVLEWNTLYLHERLPEIAVSAAGGWEGAPLSRLVQASGIDRFEIEHAVDGQVFAGDPRPYAKGCTTAVTLIGNCMAPLGRILEAI